MLITTTRNGANFEFTHTRSTTTAQNPASISPLTATADSSYNAAQMQKVMDKLDELLNATS